jgi:hypothetical protein
MIDLHDAHVTATSTIHRWSSGNEYRCAWLVECLTRHIADDWGDLDPADQAANTRAIINSDGRVMSAYPVPAHLAGGHLDPTVWIITDDLDQPPTTTVLFPSDY